MWNVVCHNSSSLGMTLIIIHFLVYHNRLGCPCGVMVKVLNCGIVVREFELKSCYCVYFQTNILGKGMNPLILPAMG